MRRTSIAWTDYCWNITDGCSRTIAEGADTSGCGDPTGGGCYAEQMAYRFSGPGLYYEGLVRMTPNGARWTGKVRFNAHKLADPLRLRGNQLIFVASTSDPFHRGFSDDEIAAMYGGMAATGGRHIFQLLTKRAKRRREWHEWILRAAALANGGVGMTPAAYCFAMAQKLCDDKALRKGEVVDAAMRSSWPLPNVWEGVSVEHQPAAHDRIPDLLHTPAALRWLSIEPMLGEVDLLPWLDPSGACDCPPYQSYCKGGCAKNASWRGIDTKEGDECPVDPDIGWVVAGCESGHKSRAADVNWYRELRDQCARYGVPFLLKQAEHTPGEFISPATLAVGFDVPLSRMKQRRSEAAYATGCGDLIELPHLDGRVHAEIPGRHLVEALDDATITPMTFG